MSMSNTLRMREIRSAATYIAGYTVLFSIFLFSLIAISQEAQHSIALLRATALYSFIAAVLGKTLLSSIARYPGVETSSYILPSFSSSYGILLLFLILSRLEYSRALLLGGFSSAVIWSYIWDMRLNGRKVLRIGIVPSGDSLKLKSVDTVKWTVLEHPQQEVGGLDSVAIDLRSQISDEWERRLADYALQGLPVYHSKHLLESMTGRVELESLSENSFGTLSPVSAYMTAKHVIDWGCALLIGTVLSPFLCAIAILIRLDSPGGAIFRQTRIGYCGRPFTVYKFRTMTSSSSGAQGNRDEAMTRSDDHRVTRIGAFLRKSRIDELPQLFNVIKGEMSWIGPRPEAEVLSRWYEEEIPFYRYRHIVRPGITGWAQVNQGHVAELEEVMSKLHYDFYYIKNYSPWIDLLISFRTMRTMITGFGAR